MNRPTRATGLSLISKLLRRGSKAGGEPSLSDRGDSSFGKSIVGQVREQNEDAFFISPDSRVFVVADGLGGHAAGEVASALAVEAVRQTLLDRDGKLREVSNLAQLLADAFTLSYISIGARVAANPECDGMGTTLIVAAVQGGRVAVAHAGDVRGYRHGRDGLARLTLDHSVVARMVREGHLSEADVSWHPLRNRIYRVVSGDEPCRPDVSWYDISAGECLLLCSDGLWSELSDQAIADVIERGGTAKEIVTVLVDRANEAGGRDNITAVLYHHY